MPLSKKQEQSNKYIKGVACPNCYGTKTKAQINKYKTRNNQLENKI